MATQSTRLIYVDGFAGPGRYAGGEDGSPLVAVKAASERSRPITAEVTFLFIELDRECRENLERELSSLEIPDRFELRPLHGRFDEAMTLILDGVERRGAGIAPLFAFVDPFGWSQTPMSLIARLLSNPRCEVLITFIYEEINRFLGVGGQDANWDALFGTTDWRAIVGVSDPRERRRQIHDLYARQLSRNARFVRSFEMRNIRNATDYFLYFATNHPTGLEKMKEAMWRVDPVGGGVFSDSTNPQQLVLFGDPDFALLRRQIATHFAGRTVGVPEVERFVVEETAFLRTHLRQHGLRPMESSKPPGLVVVRAPSRKKGSFTPDATLTFPEIGPA